MNTMEWQYVHDWVRQYKLEKDSDPLWAVIEYMLNVIKNYDTAAALMFDLSYQIEPQKKWLRRCADELGKLHKEFPGTVFDRTYLYEWCAWYTKDVEAEPAKTL